MRRPLAGFSDIQKICGPFIGTRFG